MVNEFGSFIPPSTKPRGPHLQNELTENVFCGVGCGGGVGGLFCFVLFLNRTVAN